MEPEAGASNQLAAGAGEAAACLWRRGPQAAAEGAPALRLLGEEAREREMELEQQGEESGPRGEDEDGRRGVEQVNPGRSWYRRHRETGGGEGWRSRRPWRRRGEGDGRGR